MFFSQQQLHARYVLQILGETWRLLRILPNINHVSVCHTKEITICGTLKRLFLGSSTNVLFYCLSNILFTTNVFLFSGDLHGQLEDLLLIFYKV